MIGAEQLSLTKLLIAKEKELKDTLKLADEQAKINEKMNLLKSEVDRQDQYIQQFERLLKEAEQILVNFCLYLRTIFQVIVLSILITFSGHCKLPS